MPASPWFPPAAWCRWPVGATAGLLITGQIPAGAVPGQTAQLTLRAVSQLQSATATNTDTINLTNGAAVQVSYSASTATASRAWRSASPRAPPTTATWRPARPM
jgi:hypothetical protein